ncbi:hypothetical protein GPECTOR_105g92 [Gonium pectorale]|uniref:Ricin B lectin domain-containing protein n=1 Tax=Gonium pectorale TaxID=33097 RepID=A0A150G197_GONPE|nr:hypothetical protein GPECTOR_105g92 [Gonium pectorale]|eukprot:KXZ43060.1 hypothetical protein GPECTOR_105g92 [Gonium pectorale]
MLSRSGVQYAFIELKICNTSAWDQIYRIFAHPYGGYYMQPRHMLDYRVDVYDACPLVQGFTVQDATGVSGGIDIRNAGSAAAAAEACAYTPYCKHFLSSGELKVNVSSTFPAANSCLYTRPKSDGLVHNSIVIVGTATSFGSCVHGGVTENTVLGQLPCSGSPNQAFYLASRGDHWTVRSLNGLCWSIFGGTPGTQAILATCNGADVQLFNFTAAVGGGYNIRPKHAPSYCLTTEAVSGAVRVGIALCNQLPAQQFEVAMSAAPSPPLPPSPRPPSPRPPSPQPPTPRPQTVCSALAGFTSRADVTAFSGYHVRQAGSLSEAVQICSYNPWCRFVNSTSLILRSVTAGPMDGACLYTRNSSVNGNGWWKLRTDTNLLCVGMRNRNNTRGTYVVLKTCTNEDDEFFNITAVPGGGYNFQPKNAPGMCVNVQADSQDNDRPLVISECAGTQAQIFQPLNQPLAPTVCAPVAGFTTSVDVSAYGGVDIQDPGSVQDAARVCGYMPWCTYITNWGLIKRNAAFTGYGPVTCLYTKNTTGDRLVHGKMYIWGTSTGDSGRCFDMRGNYNPNVEISQYACVNSENHDLFLEDAGSGWWKLRTLNGLCVGLRNNGTAAGTRLALKTCNRADDEYFNFTAVADAYTLRPRHAQNMCVDVENASQDNGRWIQLGLCNGTQSQLIKPLEKAYPATSCAAIAGWTATVDVSAYGGLDIMDPGTVQDAARVCGYTPWCNYILGTGMMKRSADFTGYAPATCMYTRADRSGLVDRAQVIMGTSTSISGSCWDQGGITVGVEVYQYSCSDVINHKFYLESAAGGWWRLRTYNGLCFGFQNAGTARQTRMTLKNCNTADDQLFNFTAVAGGGYTVRPKHAPGMCVAVEGEDGGNGRRIQLWECTTGAQSQLFQPLVTVPAPTVCPDVAGFNTSLDTMVMASGRDVTNAGSVASAAQACAYLPWCTYVSNSGFIKRDGDLIYGPVTCLYTRNPASELINRGRFMLGTSMGSSTSCWDVINANFVVNQEVQQWPCSNNNDAQRFYLEAASGSWSGYWKLRTVNGLCFGVRNAGTVRQTRVVLKDCANADDQLFNFTAVAGGGYTIQPKHAPGMCVDVENADGNNGRRIQLWECAGTQSQLFQALVTVPAPTVCSPVAGFTALVDTMAIGGSDISNRGSVDNAASYCSYTPWCSYVTAAGLVKRSGDTIYGPATCLYSKNANRSELVHAGQVILGTALGSASSCFDATGNGLDNPIVQYGCHGGTNQRFYLESAADGLWRLRSSTGFCFGFENAGTARTTRMILKNCAKSDDQLFNFTAVAGGGYTIRPKHALGMCVAVEGADGANDRRILLESCTAGAQAQLFQALVTVPAPTSCPAVAGFTTSVDTMVAPGGLDVTNAGSVANAAQTCSYLPWCNYVSASGFIRRSGDIIYGPLTCLYTRNSSVNELVNRGRVMFGTSLGSSTSCWDAVGGSLVANNEIQQYSCTNNNDAQRFYLEAASGSWSGYWKLRTVNGLCFGVRNAGTVRQTRVVLKDCATADDQLFNITAVAGGGYTIQPKHAPGMCVDVENADGNNGRRIQLWECAGTQSQLFQALVTVPAPTVCSPVAGFTAMVDTMAIGGSDISNQGSPSNAASFCSYMPWCTYVTASGLVKRSGDTIYGPATCLYSKNANRSELVNAGQAIFGTALGSASSCFDVGSNVLNSEVVQWGCHGGNNQRYYLESADGGWWKVRSTNGFCYGFQNAGTARQTLMVLKACANADDQLFNFTAVASGGYTLFSFSVLSSGGYLIRPKIAQNNCLDVEGASGGNGAQIQMYGCNSSAAQQFQLSP